MNKIKTAIEIATIVTILSDGGRFLGDLKFQHITINLGRSWNRESSNVFGSFGFIEESVRFAIQKPEGRRQ